nr:hypothetical protein [uncultured Pseudoxanthomonas sp.]
MKVSEPKIRRALSEALSRVDTDGRNTDRLFGDSGFASVRYEVGMLVAVYGQDSYDLLIESRSSPERFEAFRDAGDVMRRRLASAEGESPSALAKLFETTIADPTVDCLSKDKALRRYFPGRKLELFLPFLPGLRDARDREEGLLCKSEFSENKVSLLDRAMSGLRFDIFNAVAESAFGEVGFELAKKERGLRTFTRPIDSNFCWVLRADDRALKQHFQPWEDVTAYWRRAHMDMILTIRNTDSGKDVDYFLSDQMSIARARMGGYEDSRSLEVAIRGYALWYGQAMGEFDTALERQVD